MGDNQEADIHLLSIMKGKQKVDEFGMWAKLKTPKEEGPEVQDEENTDAGDHDQKIGNELNKDMQRVCHYCNKVFNSGKALGGHMRVHAQPGNKKDLVLKARQTIKFKKQNPRDEKVKRTACIICGKDFPSMKSLFGHMRCHPERDWRGIAPPSNTSSSSSSLSEVDIDDAQKLLASAAVDLTESLSGWAVTARRGRKALTVASSSDLSSLEDDTELLDAVNDLMMLSRGEPCESGEQKLEQSAVANSLCEAQAVGKAYQEMVDDLEQNHLSDDDQMDSKNHGMNGRDFKMVSKNKKKRKKIKLCELEVDKNGSLVTSDKYKCSTCDKSFPTYQALGGHRSSHNKFTIVISNSIEEDDSINPSNHPIAQVEENNKNSLPAKVLEEGAPSRQVPSGSDVAKCVLDFDLNELPPPEDETTCT